MKALSRKCTAFLLSLTLLLTLAPTALASGAAAMARCTSASSGCARSMTKCVMPSNVTRTACTSGQSAGCTARGSGITVDASPPAVTAITG